MRIGLRSVSQFTEDSWATVEFVERLRRSYGTTIATTITPPDALED
jgi:hypothetical protein